MCVFMTLTLASNWYQRLNFWDPQPKFRTEEASWKRGKKSSRITRSPTTFHLRSHSAFTKKALEQPVKQIDMQHMVHYSLGYHVEVVQCVKNIIDQGLEHSKCNSQTKQYHQAFIVLKLASMHLKINQEIQILTSIKAILPVK